MERESSESRTPSQFVDSHDSFESQSEPEIEAMDIHFRTLELDYKYIPILDTPDVTIGEEGSNVRNNRINAINHRIHEALINDLV